MNSRPPGPGNVQLGRNPAQRHSTIERRLSEAIAVGAPEARTAPGQRRGSGGVRRLPALCPPGPAEAAPEVKEIIYRCRLPGNPALGPEAAVSNEVVVLDESVIAAALGSHDW